MKDPVSRPSRDLVRCTPLTAPLPCAAHAKVLAVYNKPFWREAGLSGDGVSQTGPLGEIHDASPQSGSSGALFGFASIPPSTRANQGYDLGRASVEQLAAMFGPEAAKPRNVFLKDW